MDITEASMADRQSGQLSNQFLEKIKAAAARRITTYTPSF